MVTDMSKKVVAMIPARMGSQRLKQKNLRELDGVPLIVRAVRKCKESSVFDEIWVNSENTAFQKYAEEEGVFFHKRPEELGSNTATSEDFVYEFFKSRDCSHLVQVHSIAPLLSSEEVRNFTKSFINGDYDVFLSAENVQIECAFEGEPINFTYDEKTNSQLLKPVQRITWSITGWKKDVFTDAVEKGKCATYSGRVGYFPVDKMGGLIIKEEQDLMMAEALLKSLSKE